MSIYPYAYVYIYHLHLPPTFIPTLTRLTVLVLQMQTLWPHNQVSGNWEKEELATCFAREQ